MRGETETAIRAQPFRPFSLRLADGSLVEVRHPEWIAHVAGTRTAIVVGPDESFKVLDVALDSRARRRSTAGGRGDRRGTGRGRVTRPVDRQQRGVSRGQSRLTCLTPLNRSSAT